MRIIKVKSFNWLHENAYEDLEGDYWENIEAFDAWDVNEARGSYLRSEHIDKIVDLHDLGGVLSRSVGIPLWAVEKELTKETHPEYYL